MNATIQPKSLRSIALFALLHACGPRSEAMDVSTPRLDASSEAATSPDVTSLDTNEPVEAAVSMDASASTDVVVAADSATTEAGTRCPDNAPVEMITAGDITRDTRWDCSRTWRLTGLTFVRAGATLTITPGTRIVGLGMGAAVVITRGARLDAQGTRSQPIVFTSANPVGMRRQGDWAGLVLLGAAPINVMGMGGASGTNNIEGIEASDSRGNYGGADPEHNCGTVRYVRIEFAGQGLSMGNELNGLTTGGCGRGTTIDYVHVHQAADDAFEFFGGTHSATHLISTQQDDDGLDWDLGYSGRVQFMVIQSPAMSGESDPRGVEADNNNANHDALPRSSPTIYNLSVFGAEGAEAYTQPGVVLRRGTAGLMHNVLITDYKQGAVDVIDNSTVALARATPATLSIANAIFFNNGSDGRAHFTDLSSSAAEGSPALDEDMFFRDISRSNRFDVDPMIPGRHSVTAPVFAPAATSPCATGAATPPTGFDTSATFVGAVRPGATGESDWTTGWTAYPAN
ncbi:MAG: hypothetical protein Q8Q09_04730 [Deltaproteobacteria bacterium]|nr:hypothetical protein [Deltaproteobacteria bacterium]